MELKEGNDGESNRNVLPSDVVEKLKRYDLEALTYFVHSRGKRSHLKYVFQVTDEYVIKSTSSKEFLQDFAALNKLAQDANIPALFLVNHEYHMSCGVLHNRQLLIVSPLGESSVIKNLEQVFRALLTTTDNNRIEKLYVCSNIMVNNLKHEWCGSLCVELLSLFEECYDLLPQKFNNWSEITDTRAKKDYWGFSYYNLHLTEILPDCALTKLFQDDTLIQYPNIKDIIESQVGSIQALLLTQASENVTTHQDNNISLLNQIQARIVKDNRSRVSNEPYFESNIKRALWQIVIRWLAQEIPKDTLAHNENYTELLQLIRRMIVQGTAEIDKLLFNIQRIALIQQYSDSDSETRLDADPVDKKSLAGKLAKFYWNCDKTHNDTRRLPSGLIWGGLEGGVVDTNVHVQDRPKLYVNNPEVTKQISALGGMFKLEHTADYIEFVQPLNDRLAELQKTPHEYDVVTLEQMFALRGNPNSLKRFYHSNDSETFIRTFDAFNELSLSQNLPVLFLIGFRREFFCGVVFNRQILLISPYGERNIEPMEFLLKQLTTPSANETGYKLLIVHDDMMSRRYSTGLDDWSGIVCLELLELLAQDYHKLAKNMDVWSAMTEDKPKKFMGLLYFLLRVKDIFQECPLIEHITNRNFLQKSDIVAIQQVQLTMMPVLFYLQSRNTGEPANTSHELSSYLLKSQLHNPQNLISDLFSLIEQGALDKLAIYLDSNPNCLGIRNSQGAFALHEAVSYNNPTQIRLEVIKMILARGAKLNEVTSAGSTAFHLVAKATNATEVLEILLSNFLNQLTAGVKEKIIEQLISTNRQGSELSSIVLREILDAPDQFGMTPLHYALVSGNIDTAESLLLHGASLTGKDSVYNLTPLFLCFKIASIRIVEKVLSLFLAYASPEQIRNELDAADSDGNTLMHLACVHGSYRVVQTLVRLGAKAGITNLKNETPIQCLKDPENSDSHNIIACLSGLPINEAEALLVPSYHSRNCERYLRRLHNLIPPQLPYKQSGLAQSTALVPDNQNPQNSASISTPAYFAQKVGSMGKLSTDLKTLNYELNAQFAGLSSTVTKIFNTARALENADKNLYSQFRCGSFLTPYSCLIELIGNPDILYAMMTASPKRLEDNSAHCLLVLKKLESSLKELTTACHLLEGQMQILKAQNVLGEMQDSELLLIFPSHNPNTLRLVTKDKLAYEVFTSGISSLLTNNKNTLNNHFTIKAIFTSLQKLIATIQLLQQVFKISVSQNPQDKVDLIVRELKARLIAIMNGLQPEQAREESSISIEESKSELSL